MLEKHSCPPRALPSQRKQSAEGKWLGIILLMLARSHSQTVDSSMNWTAAI